MGRGERDRHVCFCMDTICRAPWFHTSREIQKQGGPVILMIKNKILIFTASVTAQSSTSCRSSPKLLLFIVECIEEDWLGMNVNGGMPKASPNGLVSRTVGGLNESLTFPLHEAVRRELAKWELLPPVAPCFEMFPILGNFCMATADTCFGGWYDQSFVEDVEGSSLAALSSWLLSAIASIVLWFDDGAGAGTKNLALAGRTGFTDGTEGGWNKFAEFPPPWLKVSTYLCSQ